MSFWSDHSGLLFDHVGIKRDMLKILRPRDFAVAAFLFVLSALAMWEASRLGIGEWSHPGPGFVPFYLGLILALVSLGLLLQGARCGKDAKPAEEAPPLVEAPNGQRKRRKVLWTLGALAAYAFSLEPAGYLLATFLFLLFLFRVVEPRRWRAALGGSFAAATLTYALFYLLRVRLPSGFWVQ